MHALTQRVLVVIVVVVGTKATNIVAAIQTMSTVILGRFSNLGRVHAFLKGKKVTGTGRLQVAMATNGINGSEQECGETKLHGRYEG